MPIVKIKNTFPLILLELKLIFCHHVGMTENLKAAKAESPVDIERLRSYCAGLEELVQKVLGAFMLAGPSYLVELTTALESGNVEEIRALCHKIRGAGSIVHAIPMLAIIAQIRQSSIDAECDRAKEYLSDLAKAFTDIFDFIEKHGFTPS